MTSKTLMKQNSDIPVILKSSRDSRMMLTTLESNAHDDTWHTPTGVLLIPIIGYFHGDSMVCYHCQHEFYCCHVLAKRSWILLIWRPQTQTVGRLCYKL